MRKGLLGVLVFGLVLAFGLSMADAQAKPSAGPANQGAACLCGGMVGGPMMGRCGCGVTGRGAVGHGMMRGPVMGKCGCGMTGRRMTGRRMMGGCGCDMAGRGMMGRGMWMKGEKGMSGMHHRLWHHVMNLDLDQKQKAGIRKIKTDLMKKMIRKKADLKIARLELGGLVHADKTDMKKVEAKVEQMEGLRSSMVLSGIEAIEAVKSLLTADQREELESMIQGPGKCIMSGDDMMSGRMTDEDMMEKGTMGEAPAGQK